MKYITEVTLCVMGSDWNIILNSIDMRFVVAYGNITNNVCLCEYVTLQLV